MRPRTLKSAAEHGDLEAVRYHLSRGADINATTAAGHFALDGAIINGHSHVVEYLIDSGADIEQMSENGWSPLYVAAWTGSAESAALLLIAGAKINTKTVGGRNSPSGYSPLHIAAERGRLALVMLLVAAGAQVDARNGSSETALDLAVESGHTAIVKFLTSKPHTTNGQKQGQSGTDGDDYTRVGRIPAGDNASGGGRAAAT